MNSTRVGADHNKRKRLTHRLTKYIQQPVVHCHVINMVTNIQLIMANCSEQNYVEIN